MSDLIITDNLETITDNGNLSNNPTRPASPIASGASLVDELRSAGLQVLVAGEKEYEVERNRCWNKDVIHKPAALVQPSTTADVCAAVRLANQHGARLVIAGGRHGNDCMADEALTLDMSRMTAVTVDPEAKTVTAEGGARLGDMDAVCKEYGLAAVTGTNKDTGVVGLSTCGGGGYLNRLHGLAVDNFVAAEVVLASGVAVTATKDNEHADLLWGLQGGSSNFGVVTKLTQRAHPINHVFGGMVVNVAMKQTTARSVVANWRDWLLDSPRSVTGLAVLPCGAPVVPMLVAELDQKVVPQAADARPMLKDMPNLKGALSGRGAFGSWISLKSLKRMQYHDELQDALAKEQASGHYYDAAVVVPELSADVIKTLIEFTRVRNPNKTAAVIIFPLNGAIADVEPAATAFGRRFASGFWIIIEGKFDPDAAGKNRQKVVEWVCALRKALQAFDVVETAHNLDGNMEKLSDELKGRATVYGANEERLRQIKAKYDLDNFFQCNRNIRPAVQ